MDKDQQSKIDDILNFISRQGGNTLVKGIISEGNILNNGNIKWKEK